MLIENTYQPNLHLQPEMLDQYVYLISFSGTIPPSVTLMDTTTNLLLDPLYYKDGYAFFQPTSPDFLVYFKLDDMLSGNITIKEGLVPLSKLNPTERKDIHAGF